MQPHRRNAFTLVEILIVVVILGVLSAIVVPKFSESTEEAASAATLSQLRKLRDVLAVYEVRNGYARPDIQPGAGTWGELVTTGGYLTRPPVNSWVGRERGTLIVFAENADAGYHTDYGWVYNQTTGEIWAAGFDEDDNPYPKQ